MLNLLFDRRSIQLYLCFMIFFFLSNIFFINFLEPISIIDISIVDLNSLFFKISIIFFLILFSTFFIKERLEYEVRILNIKKIYNLFIFIILIAISFNFLKIFSLTNELPNTLSYYCIPSLMRNIWLKSNFNVIYKLTSIMSFLLSNFVFFILFFLYFFKKYFSRKKQILIYILMGILIGSFFFTNISRQFLINFLTFYLCIIVIDICFTKKNQFLIKDFLLLIFPLFFFFLVTYLNIKCTAKNPNKFFIDTRNEIINNLNLKNKLNEKTLKKQIYNFRILENNKKEKKLVDNFSESTKFLFLYIYSSIDNSKILLKLDKNNNNQKLHTFYIKYYLFSDFDFIKKIDMLDNHYEYFDYKIPGSVGYIALAYNDLGIFFYLILIIIFFLVFLFLKKLLEKNFYLLGLVLILILYFSIQSILFNTPFSFNFRHFTFIFIVFSLFLSKNLKLLRCY